MIYTVTLNPSLDYVVNLQSYSSGHTNRSESERIYIGGKGINVSIVLSNLGMDCKALGIVSGFTGRYIVDALNHMNVQNDFVVSDSGFSRINVKIKSSDETEINANGPDYTKKDTEEFFSKINQVQSGDFIVLSGSVPKSMGAETYKDIIQQASQKDIKTVVDSTGELLTKTLPLRPFLIKPNKAELEQIFDTKIISKDEIVRYGKKLLGKGAQNVIVSLGKDGAVFINEQNIYYLNSPKGKLINSVGSGDSMVAGFIYGYIEFKDFEEAFKFSVSCGSATAFSDTLATKAEIQDLYKKISKGA